MCIKIFKEKKRWFAILLIWIIAAAALSGIVAATFDVLITQPVMDLRAFGFAVAIGLLVGTFLIRPIVIQELIVILSKFIFWQKIETRLIIRI